ncbi:MAG TPA: LysM peptidoglycan-binding domain-containing protein [Anaerolineales bacterium]|jgi:nucleoid-associated protein YgaU
MAQEGKTDGGDKQPRVDASAFAGAKIKAEHEVKEGETLSGLALKYYGSASEANWKKIYEQNKAVIGDNPNSIKPGLRLRIPELD